MAETGVIKCADRLIEIVRDYNPQCDAARIRAAFELCVSAHAGQTRHSGEPYSTHPIAVAGIIAGMCLDDTSIITALLHDTIEDTDVSYADICAQFGQEIGDLVDGVTKLTNLEISPELTQQKHTQKKHTQQEESFRKLFLAMSRDLRVILVKLSDRLHNMRTISHMDKQKQQKKARETLDIYAPLAGRIGMQEMRVELEDLAFAVINPGLRKTITKRLIALRGDPKQVIEKISEDICKELKDANIVAELKGRAKKPYSILQKIEEKRTQFHRLSDIYAFRVIVETHAECYVVLGALHKRWRAVPGRFKDYISHPKPNGYRSLHTTVSGRDGKYVEIQIRTRQMDEVAENGVAAHWAYKDGVRIDNPFATDPVNWVSALNEQMKDIDGQDDFLEQMKLEIYTGSIFVFTPKGDVIELPRGATSLDFAYAIHTGLGHACAGAKVDGKRVPLWSALEMGQTVEIIRAQGQSPQKTWLEIVKTGRAKGAINRAVRDAERVHLLSFGEEVLQLAFAKHGRRLNKNILARAAKQQGMANADALLAEIGNGKITADTVVLTLFPDAIARKEDDIPKGQALIGMDNKIRYTLAKCCQPLPGERIVGILKPREGFDVHAIDCYKLMEFETHKWTDLRWKDGQHAPKYIVTLRVVMGNSEGVLGRVCSLIGKQKVNISDVKTDKRRSDYYVFYFDLELRDNRALHSIIIALEADSDIASVRRLKDIKEEEKDGDAVRLLLGDGSDDI